MKSGFNSLATKIVNMPLRAFLGFFLMYSGSGHAEMAIDFQTPVSEIGREILTLHHAIFFICVAIFVAVTAVMFYSMFKHTKKKGHKAAKFSHSTTVEVVWTVIPFLILVAMAVPSTATLIKMEDTTESDLTLKITGYQWYWKYEYLDSGVEFISKLSTPRAQIEGLEEKGENYLLEVDNEVVVPVGKKIRLLISSGDVIHAWWVPALFVKKDAVPGFITEMWTRIDEPGTYRGVCAELCGRDHGFMPIVVKAVSEQEFETWMEDQPKDTQASAF